MKTWRDSTAARCEALRAVPYFAPLSEEDLRDLAASADVVRRRRREVVFQEGDACDALYVIAAGRVRILKQSPEGREQVLHLEESGALGEVPLIDGGPFPASADVAEDTVLLRLPRSTVLAWCRRHGDLALGIAAVLARRVRRFATLAESLSLHLVGQRLATHLVELAEASGTATFELVESNQEIAARIGTVRELVSRILSELRRQGLIEIEGRRITVLDLDRLAQGATSSTLSEPG